jgi:CHAT domain-containing protein/Flp pilus assembly protein TadD
MKPGTAIAGVLRGGESHSYSLNLKVGLFVSIRVNSHAADLTVDLLAPDGSLIASADNPDGNDGSERLSAIAAASGNYRIQIKAADSSAPIGKYDLKVSPLRLPSKADRTRVSAERAFREGMTLSEQSGPDAISKALEQLEFALPLWHNLGDRYSEGLTLSVLAGLHTGRGEKQKALAFYIQALPLWHTLRARDWESITLTKIGKMQEDLGDRPKALDSYGKALALYRALGDTYGEALVLNNIGNVYGALGEKDRQLDCLKKSLALWRTTTNRTEEAATLSNLGVVYSRLGENKQALNYQKQALDLLHDAGNKSAEAQVLNNIGSAYDNLGDKRNALDNYLRACEIERSIGEQYGEAAALNNIGRIRANLGEQQKALNNYEAALALWQSLGRASEQAATLSNMGRIYGDSGSVPKALDCFAQALALARKTEDRSGEAQALNNMGSAYDAMGDRPKALAHYSQALPIWRALGRRSAEVATLNNIGLSYAASGDQEKGLEYLTQAFVLSRAISDTLLSGDVLHNLMLYWEGRGNAASAIAFGKEAISFYQGIRRNIRGMEESTQKSFLESRQNTYRELVELLIRQGRLAEGEEILGLLKKEEYFEFIRRDGSSAESVEKSVSLNGEEQEFDRKLQQGMESITAAGRQWAELDAKPNRTSEEERRFARLSAEVKQANASFSEFLNSLSVELGRGQLARSETRALNAAVSNTQQDILQHMDSGTVALFTLVAENKYHVIVVTPSLRIAREYPIAAADLWKKVMDFREVLRDPASDPLPEAQELYKILISPIEKDLEGARAETLMWSLDGVLRYLPFAALHDGTRYLLEKYKNGVFTPENLTRLSEPSINISLRAAGMGISKAYGSFPPLPAVPGELHGIIREEGTDHGIIPGEVILDEAFTEDSLKRILRQKFSLVHIASHFHFHSGNETDSFLLLAGSDGQGARLTLADIRTDPGIRFSGTELLTLSACETALSGNNGDGREVDGLGMLAQEKGAKAVLATLWRVEDESTGLLMQAFYRFWSAQQGISKAEALQRAQIALMRGQHDKSSGGNTDKQTGPLSFRHPYFWAPFILIGNWK